MSHTDKWLASQKAIEVERESYRAPSNPASPVQQHQRTGSINPASPVQQHQRIGSINPASPIQQHQRTGSINSPTRNLFRTVSRRVRNAAGFVEPPSDDSPTPPTPPPPAKIIRAEPIPNPKAAPIINIEGEATFTPQPAVGTVYGMPGQSGVRFGYPGMGYGYGYPGIGGMTQGVSVLRPDGVTEVWPTSTTGTVAYGTIPAGYEDLTGYVASATVTAQGNVAGGYYYPGYGTYPFPNFPQPGSSMWPGMGYPGMGYPVCYPHPGAGGYWPGFHNGVYPGYSGTAQAVLDPNAPSAIYGGYGVNAGAVPTGVDAYGRKTYADTHYVGSWIDLWQSDIL